jgi:F420-0:gamma-glutamyl ligase
VKPVTYQPIQTPIFKIGESVADFVFANAAADLVRDGMILVITSKIVSLAENRLVAKSSIEKADLIAREAEHHFGEGGYGCFLTIKHGLFIPSAGIDESNSETGAYILYPEDPFKSAKQIWSDLKTKWKIENLGVILTDSHTTPLRNGVTGIALAHWGFHGVKSLVGEPDLFGRKIQMTFVNIADGLAAGATLLMGEGNERQPLAVIHNATVSFVNEIDPAEIRMPLKDDLYLPFLLKSRLRE